MSGHLDGPPPGPPDPPYIPGDLGAPSAKEFARRRTGDRHMSDTQTWECCGHTFTGSADFISGARSAHVCKRTEDAIRSDERERLSARVHENGWCPTCARSAGSDGEDR